MKRQSSKPVLSFLDPNVPQPVRKLSKRSDQHLEQENQVKRIKLPYSGSDIKNVLKSNLNFESATNLELVEKNCCFLSHECGASPEWYKNILEAELELEHRSKLSKTFCISTKITASHRELVVEWLIEMQTLMKTSNDVLHLAITLLDLVLDKEVIEEDKLQLLAAASIWLSYKFHYGRIKVQNILKWCHSIALKELIQFERKILKVVDMNVMFSNSVTILNIQLHSVFGCEIPTIAYHASNYLFEIMLLNVDFLQESVNVRTMAAVYTSLFLLKSQKITFSQDLVDSRRLKLLHVRLLSILRTIRDNPTFRKKSSLFKKYYSTKYLRISANLGVNLE